MIGVFAMAFQRSFLERDSLTIFIEGGSPRWTCRTQWVGSRLPAHYTYLGRTRTASERRRGTPINGHSTGRLDIYQTRVTRPLQASNGTKIWDFCSTTQERSFILHQTTDCTKKRCVQQELVIAYGFPKSVKPRSRINELIQAHQKLLACAAEDGMDRQPLSPAKSNPDDIIRLLEQ